jgi:hypothetical protein
MPQSTLFESLKLEVSFISGEGDFDTDPNKIDTAGYQNFQSKIHLGSCEWENVKRHRVSIWGLHFPPLRGVSKPVFKPISKDSIE